MNAIGADDVKAAAKARLQAAKDLLEVLERWGFPADVIARRAESLGQSVAKAAADFSAAASSPTATAVSTPIDGIIQAPAPQPERAMNAAMDADGKEERENGLGSLPDTYRDVMGSNDDRGRTSSDDQNTMNEFCSVANRIKALLQKATREMHEDISNDHRDSIDSSASESV